MSPRVSCHCLFTNADETDGRRYIRPFFLTPEGKPLARKMYYDVFTWIITQVSFAFVVLPFMLLQIRPVLQVWSSVYYFEIILSIGGMALFASPVKGILAKKVKAMQPRPGMERVKSEGGPDVMLGVPADPEKELQDISAEIKAEIDRRKSQGLPVPDVRVLVNQKLDQLERKKEL
jgi:lysophospholipid acyltransferase